MKVELVNPMITAVYNASVQKFTVTMAEPGGGTVVATEVSLEVMVRLAKYIEGSPEQHGWDAAQMTLAGMTPRVAANPTPPASS